ncbi:MAG: choice-of-anchor E domain-containing protein [Kiritimatiellae bacterium]|nr:choice-of-anchor E domain-containing protein [Kiritimatiellia bacterium]
MAILLGTGLTFSGRAATITETEVFSGIPNLTADLEFNQFDQPAWGTINSILITLVLYANGGALRVDNDSTGAASSTVGFGGQATLTSADVVLLNGSFQNPIGTVVASTSNSVSLAANDGDAEVGGTANFSAQGSDYGQVLGQSVSRSSSGEVASMFWSSLTGFIGTGSYTLTLNASQYLNLGSLGGAQQQIDPLSVSGTVSVTYDYTGDGPPPPPQTPEPSTLVLAGGSLLGWAFIQWWKRRNRDRTSRRPGS